MKQLRPRGNLWRRLFAPHGWWARFATNTLRRHKWATRKKIVDPVVLEILKRGCNRPPEPAVPQFVPTGTSTIGGRRHDWDVVEIGLGFNKPLEYELSKDPERMKILKRRR